VRAPLLCIGLPHEKKKLEEAVEAGGRDYI
jgi:hypothetical protein